jgi:hypothetical protein
MNTMSRMYPELIAGKAKKVVEGLSRKRMTGASMAFLALANAVARKYAVANDLIEKIDPIALNQFTDQEKSYFYETQVVLAAHSKAANLTVSNLCRRAISFHAGAFFARFQLAMSEARFDPHLAVVQLEILHGLYPNQEDVLFTYVRMLLEIHKDKEANQLLKGSPNRFRKALYWVMMNIFTKWVIYTFGFALLIILIYTPLVSWIFYGLCLVFCSWLIEYGFRKKDPFIFNFFVSVIIVVSILIAVKWLAFRS